jgi:PAS domain S-box-containing protein
VHGFQDLFRAFMDNGPAIAWLKDDEGRHVYLNRALQQRFYDGSKEWYGKTDFELWPPEMAARFRESDLAVLGAERTIDVIEETINPDGSRSWWWNFRFPFRDSSGKRYVGGMGIEISERKRLEAELSKLAAVVRHSNEFVGLATLDGEIIYVNETGARMVGSSREEMMGMSVIDFVSEPFRDKVLHEVFPALKEKGSWEGELGYSNRTSGETMHVNAMTFVVHDPETGAPLYLANTSRDITGRKRAEEALLRARDELEERVLMRTEELEKAYLSLKRETEERQFLEERLRQSQKMEAIGTLAGGIAHDFNNILAGIIGFTEMVEEDLPEDSHLREYVRRILKASLRGRDLVKQILTFSRKADHVRAPISLTPVINETCNLLRASFPAGIEIFLDMSATMDRVNASAVELQQVLMNLATNGAHAMRGMEGTLNISLGEVDLAPPFPLGDPEMKPGGYLELAVTDTGEGMTPDVMKRVFEPFFTTRGIGEGTGMGLAVVYGIVKGLGGTITVESEPQMGSTFRVLLPKAGAGSESEAPLPRRVRGGTERVLFVDDEDLLVDLAHDLLESLGYRVTGVTDSTQALRIFSSDPASFDLVITDQIMPGLTGLNLAERFLGIRKDIPIILCTGHSATVSPEVAKKAGIRAFVMKPLSKEDLTEVIRAVLDVKAVQ